MLKEQRQERWGDWRIPLFWNRWFQIGLGTLVAGVVLGLYSAALVRAAAPRADALTPGSLAWVGYAISLIGFVFLGATGFGKETVKTYRTTRRRIEENQRINANGQVAKPQTWKQQEYVAKAHTYCAKIGIAAAAFDYGLADDLPADFADWTKIEWRRLPARAWLLLACTGVGAVLLGRANSIYWEALGVILVVFGMSLLAIGQRLRLWTT
jgi:hypothetical protein